MRRELEAINKNGTWEITEKPDTIKILDTKWVYTYKPLEKYESHKYKARVVVRGFAQEKNVDYEEIHSPVCRMTTIRTLLNIGVKYNHYFRQLDVKTTFLNDILDDEIYIFPPKGYPVETGKVL